MQKEICLFVCLLPNVKQSCAVAIQFLIQYVHMWNVHEVIR